MYNSDKPALSTALIESSMAMLAGFLLQSFFELFRGFLRG